jgi:small GTP-binding protein
MNNASKYLKFVFLGPASVGKTSLINRYLDRPFKNYKSTIGFDFYSVTTRISTECEVTLRIYDTSPTTIKSSMLNFYVYEADAIFLVYDMTVFSSYQKIPDYIEKLRKIGVKGRLILVGNKCNANNSFS